MITILVVKFCLTLNPYLCHSIEMMPEDRHMIVSVPECIKGGAIGGMTFVMDHMEWYTKGWRCEERPNIVTLWMNRSE